MSIKVDVDLQRIYDKFGENNIAMGRWALGYQMMADMNKFVPRKDGILRMNVHVTTGGHSIVYSQPYASKQFHNQFKNYTTPNTGPRWDEKAKAIHHKKWAREFAKGANF